MKLSEKIRIIRRARGYSQEELGYKLNRISNSGISRQAISDWENGNCEPKLDNIRDLANVLGVSFDSLLDEKIDLEDRKSLNTVLKNLTSETKGKVNNSFRYRIYAYSVTKRDYILLIGYFAFFLLSIALTIISFVVIKSDIASSIMRGVSIAFVFFSLVSYWVPIKIIKKIRHGDYSVSFGTLSQTHLVIIGWSDIKFDRTIYVPVTEIENMELAENTSKKHGKVIVHIKDRNKPIITADINEPQKLIDVFNNLDSFVENQNE